MMPVTVVALAAVVFVVYFVKCVLDITCSLCFVFTFFRMTL